MTKKELDRLSKKLAELVEIFRQGKPAKDFHWWGGNSYRSIFSPTYGHQKGQPLFEDLVQGILRLNPTMLSEDEVRSKLMYNFLQNQTIDVTAEDHAHNEKLVSQAQAFIKDMTEFEAWQDVEVAIGNLWLRGDPVTFGGITFMPLDQEEAKEWESQIGPKGDSHISIRVIAYLKAPGDRNKAISYAQNSVNQVLDIFRAFCFPFGRDSDTWRIALVDDPVSQTHTLIRINGRLFTTLVSSGIAQIDLREHILSKLQEPQWNLLHKLLEKPENSRNSMESKLVDGLHWLAESTRPDTNNSKFAKISFALETLVGGEPQNDELKVRGITAMLAERAAFIAGENLSDMLKVDNDIRTYYKKRSDIVHGGKEQVSLDDIESFGHLVRRLALTLLAKLDNLGDDLSCIEKLANWVKIQKYTLPNQNNKGV
jgi:hypothetical protein